MRPISCLVPARPWRPFGSCIGICPVRSRGRACRGIWPTRGAPVFLARSRSGRAGIDL